MENLQSVPVTTSSGFTTKNACREVPAEEIEKWYIPKPSIGFADIAGAKDLKERLLNDLQIHYDVANDPIWQSLFGKCLQTKYLFYSIDPGFMGRMVNAYIATNMDKGVPCIRLRGDELHYRFVGVAEQVIRIAFQEAMDHAPCLLVIDDVDSVCADASAATERYQLRLRAAFLEAFCNLRDSEKPVILLCTTLAPERVYPSLVDKVQLLRIPLPRMEDRVCFFENLRTTWQTKGYPISWAEDLTAEHMAAATDLYSYRQLEMLEEEMRFNLARLAQMQPNAQLLLNRELFSQALLQRPKSDMTLWLEKQRLFEEEHIG